MVAPSSSSVLELLVDREVAGEALGADRRVAATGRAQQHARAVEDDRQLEALAQQPRGGQQVDQRDRSLERHASG